MKEMTRNYGGYGNECPDCGQIKDKDGKCGCPDGDYGF